MGFRYRKSIKIVPGVRLNLSKSGISTSVGARGATVNIGRGRVRTTVGVPGTGLSYTASTSVASKSRNVRTVRQQSAEAIQPHIPTADKRILEAIRSADLNLLDQIARKQKSEHSLPAAMFAGLVAMERSPVWACEMLEWVWAQGKDPGDSRLVKSYLPLTRVTVQVTEDIEIDESLGRNLIGLLLAEARRRDRHR
jgi:hypothetical protein